MILTRTAAAPEVVPAGVHKAHPMHVTKVAEVPGDLYYQVSNCISFVVKLCNCVVVVVISRTRPGMVMWELNVKLPAATKQPEVLVLTRVPNYWHSHRGLLIVMCCVVPKTS